MHGCRDAARLTYLLLLLQSIMACNSRLRQPLAWSTAAAGAEVGAVGRPSARPASLTNMPLIKLCQESQQEEEQGGRPRQHGWLPAWPRGLAGWERPLLSCKRRNMTSDDIKQESNEHGTAFVRGGRFAQAAPGGPTACRRRCRACRLGLKARGNQDSQLPPSAKGKSCVR
jgi:hypothetical protein